MFVIDGWTRVVIKEVDNIDEGISVMSSLEKDEEMCGYEKPYFDIVDGEGNSLLE